MCSHVQLSLYGAGYLPASLLDVNAEVQRRINARQAKQSQSEQKAEQKDDKPLRLSTPDTVEAPKSSANTGPAPSTPVIFNADESMPPVSFDPMQHSASASAVYTPAGNSVQSAQSSHSPGLSDSAASSSGQTQHSTPHEQDVLRPSNTHSISSSQQQQQQQQQQQGAGGVRQTDAGEPAVQQAAAVSGVPARLLAQVDSEASAGQGSGKQRRQSKRERAKGLLSSFTGGR